MIMNIKKKKHRTIKLLYYKQVTVISIFMILLLVCSCGSNNDSETLNTEHVIDTETKSANSTEQSLNGYTLKEKDSLNNSVTNESSKYASLEEMINQITEKTNPSERN